MQEAFCIILMCVLHQDFAGLPGKRDNWAGPALLRLYHNFFGPTQRFYSSVIGNMKQAANLSQKYLTFSFKIQTNY